MAKINISLLKAYSASLRVKIIVPEQLDVKPKTKLNFEYSQSGYVYYTWLPISGSLDVENSIVISGLLPSTSYVVRCRYTNKAGIEQISDVSDYMTTLSEIDDSKLKLDETTSELISLKKELDTKDIKLKEEIKTAESLSEKLSKTEKELANVFATKCTLEKDLKVAHDELSAYCERHNDNITELSASALKISQLEKTNSAFVIEKTALNDSIVTLTKKYLI